jgi:mRNA interferase HigB
MPGRQAGSWFAKSEFGLENFALCEDTSRVGVLYFPIDEEGRGVHVISEKALREFWGSHPDAEEPLRAWHRNAERSTWTDLNSIRELYASADQVGKCIVFNVGGNKYRLIVIIRWDKVYVRHVLTHAEYNRDRWKAGCGC